MRTNIKKRWLHGNVNKILRTADWKQSTKDKFKAISPDCKTAQKILKQFDDTYWIPYKPYNPQWPMWEYMVLLKLVSLKMLNVTVVPIKGREQFVFNNPNRTTMDHLCDIIHELKEES